MAVVPIKHHTLHNMISNCSVSAHGRSSLHCVLHMASEAGIKNIKKCGEQCIVVALSIVQRTSRGV